MDYPPKEFGGPSIPEVKPGLTDNDSYSGSTVDNVSRLQKSKVLGSEDHIVKAKWSPTILIGFLNTRWTPLVHFLQAHEDLISTEYTPYNTVDIKGFSSYLKSLTLPSEKLVIGSPFGHLYNLSDSERRRQNDFIVYRFLNFGKVKSVCNIFEGHYTLQGGQGQGRTCIADHLRTFITKLSIDLAKCGELLNRYYSQNLISVLSKLSGYNSQFHMWAMRFEEHRIRIQTSLALYSSLYVGAFSDIVIRRKLAIAFSMFPELDPLRKDEENQNSGNRGLQHRWNSPTTAETDEDHTPQSLVEKTPLYKFNPSSSPSTLPGGSHSRSRTSSFSSYATARDTISLATDSSSLYNNSQYILDGVSSYSVASSRTAETDYGLFYRRMALSHTSLGSTITEMVPTFDVDA